MVEVVARLQEICKYICEWNLSGSTEEILPLAGRHLEINWLVLVLSEIWPKLEFEESEEASTILSWYIPLSSQLSGFWILKNERKMLVFNMHICKTKVRRKEDSPAQKSLCPSSPCSDRKKETASAASCHIPLGKLSRRGGFEDIPWQPPQPHLLPRLSEAATSHCLLISEVPSVGEKVWTE